MQNEEELKRCPHCGSTQLKKASFYRGTQRYLCLNCGKKVTKFTEDRFYHKSDVPCPHCGSYLNHFQGALKDGTKRRTCRNCGKSFSSKTKIVPKIEKACFYCGSMNIVRSGHGKDGIQRFLCKDCRKTFKQNRGEPSEKEILTPQRMEEVVNDYKEGYQMWELQQKFHKSKRRIQHLIEGCDRKEHLENALRRLSPKIKKEIIYFGLGAGVRVRNLSKNLKVELPIVQEVIRRYKEKYYN